MLDQYKKRKSLLIKRIVDQRVYCPFYQKFMKEWYTSERQIILNLFSMKICVDLEKHIATCFIWIINLFVNRWNNHKISLICYTTHCVKSVQIRSFFWSVFSCIRTKYGDLLRKNSVFGHFSCSDLLLLLIQNWTSKKLSIIL